MRINNKIIKRKLALMIMVGIIFMISIFNSTVEVHASSGEWIDLGGGWKFRIDGPHTGTSTGKYHVHVEGRVNNKLVRGSEGVDGSTSHGDNMNDVPNKVKKRLRTIKNTKMLKINKKNWNKQPMKLGRKI